MLWKHPGLSLNGAELATAKAHLRDAVFCSNIDRGKDMKNIGIIRIKTLKKSR